MLARLASIRNWIFDLDDTLYPASAGLLDEARQRMTRFIMDHLGTSETEATLLRERYFLQHGTTLAGLMSEHEVDPHHFYSIVHDVGLGALGPNLPLAALIARLPGRKLVFTNGDRPYALRVLGVLGLDASFEAIHDIHAMGLVPKPNPRSYRGLCDAFGLEPAESVFVDDQARNLAPAKAIGMTTVWLDNRAHQPGDADRSFIDFTTPDLGAWLATILEDQ